MNEVWNSGPPPSIGWWPASTNGQRGFYRWWNGEYWSMPVNRGADKHSAASAALERAAAPQSRICWLPRPMSWPARSHT